MAEFDAFKDLYEAQVGAAVKFIGADHDFFTRIKAEHLNEAIASLGIVERAAAVLDVGCGHGLIHPLLTKNRVSLHLTGVDVAGEVIDMARDQHPENTYATYDGTTLPFEEGSFDLSFAICVIHHVPPPHWLDFLREMRRVVRPGGRVVVIEHNPLNPATCYVVKTCPIDENAVLLRRGQLERLMRDVGFVALSGRYILFTPFEHPVMRRFDRALGRIPLGAQYFLSGQVP